MLLWIYLVICLTFCNCCLCCPKEDEDEETKGKIMLVKTYSKESPTIIVDISHRESDQSFHDEYGIDCLGISYEENDLGMSFCNVDDLGTSLDLSFSGGVDEERNHSDMEEKDPFHLFEYEELYRNDYITSTPRKLGIQCYVFEDDNEEAIDITATAVGTNDAARLSPIPPSVENIGDISISSNEELQNILEISSVYSDVELEEIDLEDIQTVTVTDTEFLATTESSSSASASRLLQKYTTGSSLIACVDKDCCGENCIKFFTTNTIRNLRLQYYSKRVVTRRKWLHDKFSQMNFNTEDLRLCTDNGMQVCQKAFRLLYKIGLSTFYIERKNYVDGITVHGNGKSRYRKRSEKYVLALVWMEDYSTFHGDRMPNSKNILLPYRTRKIVVYKQYKEEQMNSNKVIIGKSSFYTMWKRAFPGLKIKQLNMFSKCTKCSSIERLLEKTFNQKTRQKLLLLRNEHNHRQMMERKYYYRKREAAKKWPNKYLSLIIDGMDQSKTNLPHFVGRIAKAVNPGDQLGTHITGVIAHGQNKLMTFFDMNQYPHDSNLTLNVILMVLYQLSKQMGGKLPPVLYLQADNCWRENKNKFVLSFCELLVHLKVFEEVHLSFLYVGHTHEDIDASFSKIADTLRKNDAETIPEILNLLPNVQEISSLYNIKDWLQPSLNGVQKHSRPLHYKFVRNGNKVRVSYKGNQGCPWKHLPTGFFQTKPDGTYILPGGKPNVLDPKYEKLNLEKIESHLANWDCLFTDQIHKSQRVWWEAFIKKTKNLQFSKIKRYRDILKKAKWFLPELPRRTAEEFSDEGEDLPTTLTTMLEKETEESEVQITPSIKSNRGRGHGNGRGRGRGLSNGRGKGKGGQRSTSRQNQGFNGRGRGKIIRQLRCQTKGGVVNKKGMKLLGRSLHKPIERTYKGRTVNIQKIRKVRQRTIFHTYYGIPMDFNYFNKHFFTLIILCLLGTLYSLMEFCNLCILIFDFVKFLALWQCLIDNHIRFQALCSIQNNRNRHLTNSKTALNTIYKVTEVY